MNNLKKLMIDKFVAISPEYSVRKASELMEHYKTDCFPVLENNKLIGIITSRNIRSSHPNRLVADAMSKKIITISSNCSPWEAKKLFDQYQVEYLVLIEDSKPLGVITKTQLRIELERYIDALTGLKTAEFLRYKAFELLQNGSEICIIFFDLDNFGKVNKIWGHIIGDKIICQVAQILIQSIDTKADLLCRYAGDEFSILTTKKINTVMELTARIDEALKKEQWPNNLKITFSSGIARGPQHITTPTEDLKNLVDRIINEASLASTETKHKKSIKAK